MGNEQEYSQFDRYLAGDLSPEELAGFHNSLRADPALKDEFGWMQSAVTEIRGMGRALMKERVNAVALLIPESSYAPYTPAIVPNAPGFFSKWWPALAAGVAATSLLVWYFFPQDPAPQPRPAPPSQQSPGFVVPDTMLDSVLQGTGRPETMNENVAAPPVVPVSETNNCRSFMVTVTPVASNVFVEKIPQDQQNPPYLTWSASSQNKFPLELCRRESGKGAYTYSDKSLSLSAEYADTAGLRFTFAADTIYMTDSKPGYFVLVKGKKGEPLVRKSKRNISPSIGIKPVNN